MNIVDNLTTFMADMETYEYFERNVVKVDNGYAICYPAGMTIPFVARTKDDLYKLILDVSDEVRDYRQLDIAQDEMNTLLMDFLEG